MAGMAPTIRITESKTGQESQWALRSLTHTENILCASAAAIELFRKRGWGSSYDGFIFSR